ncbi:MAG: hypothetical protein SF029_08225 [bacterium]|nr:hypothetical protein [bacterium]
MQNGEAPIENPLLMMAEMARALHFQGDADLSENADAILEQMLWEDYQKRADE